MRDSMYESFIQSLPLPELIVSPHRRSQDAHKILTTVMDTKSCRFEMMAS